jgi:hypothetical protein
MMKKSLALLGMAMILMSFAMNAPVLADESSSLDPNAKSGLQHCDGYPNYGTRIDFEDVPANTIINTQYLGLGVKFGAAAGGPVTIARTDGARPLDGNILAGQPVFMGDIHASFWLNGDAAFVTQVGASVGYLDQVGTVTMTAYDCEGDMVGSYTNTISGGNGIEFFTISADTIHKVIFVVSLDPAGSDIDCFTYNELQRCATGIPTLTEWGLIIFGVILLGFITWVFLKRRKPVISDQW